MYMYIYIYDYHSTFSQLVLASIHSAIDYRITIQNVYDYQIKIHILLYIYIITI